MLRTARAAETLRGWRSRVPFAGSFTARDLPEDAVRLGLAHDVERGVVVDADTGDVAWLHVDEARRVVEPGGGTGTRTEVPLLRHGNAVVVSGRARNEETPSGTRWSGAANMRRVFGAARSLESKVAMGRAVTLVSALTRDYRFCAGCGAGGLKRTSPDTPELACPACGRTYWPRTNPCAIMLVESHDSSSVLLGRGVNWAPGRFSCLAGFCEAGESVEACAVREVQEEAGVEVEPSSVHLSITQAWPFVRVGETAGQGTSLMIALFARAVKGAVPKPDPHELAEARFFSEPEVRELVAKLTTPPDGDLPVAFWMMKAWLEAGASRY